MQRRFPIMVMVARPIFKWSPAGRQFAIKHRGAGFSAVAASPKIAAAPPTPAAEETKTAAVTTPKLEEDIASASIRFRWGGDKQESKNKNPKTSSWGLAINYYVIYVGFGTFFWLMWDAVVAAKTKTNFREALVAAQQAAGANFWHGFGVLALAPVTIPAVLISKVVRSLTVHS